MKIRKGKEQIELGLAVSALTLRLGQTRSHAELAAFCDVSRRTIQKIEQRAIRKVCARLRQIGVNQ